MKTRFSLLLLLIMGSLLSKSQEVGYNTLDIGGDFQWYPAGYMGGVHLAYNAKMHHSLTGRIAYNRANRKDFGKHENEKGGGAGFSLGYRYYFHYKPAGFFLGARSDLWSMNIDWTDGNENGSTKTWVLQPALEIGYTFLIYDKFFITPAVSNGYEINIVTKGNPVGEGFITQAGISAGFRF